MSQAAGWRSRARPSVGIATAVVLIGAALALGDASVVADVAGAVSTFVPADGQAETVQGLTEAGGQDFIGISESARFDGAPGFLAVDTVIGDHLIGQVGADHVDRAHFWRQTITYLTGADRAQTTQVYQLSGAGISLLASYTANFALTYAPALPELPADTHAGSTWSAAGTWSDQDALRYRADFAAAAHQPAAGDRDAGLTGDCLDVDRRLQYLDQSGVVGVDQHSVTTWCPGRGAVVSEILRGAGPIVISPYRAGVPATASTAVTRASWTDAAAWSNSAPPLSSSGVLAAGKAAAQVLAPPVRTQSGVLVVPATGQDLVGFTWDGHDYRRSWTAHPGGELTGVVAIDDVVVATNNRREIVAYSDTGARLWSGQTADLTRAAPVGDGADHLAVADIDGTVSRYDLRTGLRSWSVSLGESVLAAPVVTGSTLVVTDKTGHIRGLNLADGSTRWTADSGLPEGAVASASRVILLGEGSVVAYNGDTGAALWRSNYVGGVRRVLVVGDQVVIVGHDQTRSLSIADGTVTWTAAGYLDALTDGKTLVTFGPGVAYLFSADGHITASWPVIPDSEHQVRYTLSLPNGVLLASRDMIVQQLSSPAVAP